MSLNSRSGLFVSEWPHNRNKPEESVTSTWLSREWVLKTLQNKPGRLWVFSHRQFTEYKSRLAKAWLTQTGLVFLPPFIVTHDVASLRYNSAKEFGIALVKKYVVDTPDGKQLLTSDMQDPAKALVFWTKTLATPAIIEQAFQDLQIIYASNEELSIFVTQDGIFSSKHNIPQMIEVEAGSLSYTEMMAKLNEICVAIEPELGSAKEYGVSLGNCPNNYTVLKRHYEIPKDSNIHVVEYDRRNSPIRWDLVLKAQALTWNKNVFPLDPRDIWRNEESMCYTAKMYEPSGEYIGDVPVKYVMTTMLQSDFNALHDEIWSDVKTHQQIYNFFTDGHTRFIQHPALIAIWSKASMLEYETLGNGKYKNLIPRTYQNHDIIVSPGNYYQKPLYWNSWIWTTSFTLKNNETYCVPEGYIVQEAIQPQPFPQTRNTIDGANNTSTKKQPTTVEFRILLDEQGIWRFFVRTAPYFNIAQQRSFLSYGELIGMAIEQIENSKTDENIQTSQLLRIINRLNQDIVYKENTLSPLNLKKLKICIQQQRPLTNYGQAMNSLYLANLCKTLFTYDLFKKNFGNATNLRQAFEEFIANTTHIGLKKTLAWYVQQVLLDTDHTLDTTRDAPVWLEYIRNHLWHEWDPSQEHQIKAGVAPVFILKNE